MHITTVDVTSVNGKITKNQDAHAHTWTSDEDWAHFEKLRDAHKVIVMGSRTYDMVQPKPEPALLRVVLTHRPEDYKGRAVPGQLEFMDGSPEEIVRKLEKRGFDKLLLVSGQVNTQFWVAGLVDEAYVTIEPLVFGKGRNLLDGAELDIKLKLQSIEQLNQQGTVVLHYLVDKGEPDHLS